MAETQLSVNETELYDRQIRLWGIESQKKLRSADILLIHVNQLAGEILKNILLSGVNSVTICDNQVVSKEHLNKLFLLQKDVSIGAPLAEEILSKAQALNPLVSLKAIVEPVENITVEVLKQFTLVVATDCNFSIIARLDEMCRESNVKFIYGEVLGQFGFSLFDFQDHCFVVDQIKFSKGKKRDHKGEAKTVQTESKLQYPCLSSVRLFMDNYKVSKRLKPEIPLAVLMFAVLEHKEELRSQMADESQVVSRLNQILAEYALKLHPSHHFDYETLTKTLSTFAPTSAIIGGVIAQEIIKAVSHKGAPIHNIFLFDPITCSGKELSYK